MQNTPIEDIMTSTVISITPDEALSKVNEMFNKYQFNGFPVVKDEKLVGILTQYDLISRQAAIHFPTLQKVLESLPVFSGDQGEYSEDIEKIANMTAQDVMNKEPLTLKEGATLQDAIALFSKHHRVNPVPIVDAQKKVIGIISRFDVLSAMSKL